MDFFDFVVTASILYPQLTGTTFWAVLHFLHLAAIGQGRPLLGKAIGQIAQRTSPGPRGN